MQTTYIPLQDPAVQPTDRMDIYYRDIPFTLNGWMFGRVFIDPPAEGVTPEQTAEHYETLTTPLKASRVMVLNHTAYSGFYEQDSVVGQLVVTYEDLTEDIAELKLGINTAEWAYDRPDIRENIAYSKPAEGFRFRTNMESDRWYDGTYYYTSVSSNPSKNITKVGLRLNVNAPFEHGMGIALQAVTFQQIFNPEIDELNAKMANLNTALNDLKSVLATSSITWDYTGI